MSVETIQFSLPSWVASYSATYTPTTSVEARMKFVIEAARQNVKRKSGGPFAAAIFEAESGRLVSLGVNLVTTEGMSTLHAEMVAIMVAQRSVGSFDLGDPSLPKHQLVTSTEPCAMCFGAIPWSGVSGVVSGANDQDARDIGFDEGPKPTSWASELEQRGISVQEQVGRSEAVAVFDLYVKEGGKIYNAGGE